MHRFDKLQHWSLSHFRWQVKISANKKIPGFCTRYFALSRISPDTWYETKFSWRFGTSMPHNHKSFDTNTNSLIKLRDSACQKRLSIYSVKHSSWMVCFIIGYLQGVKHCFGRLKTTIHNMLQSWFESKEYPLLRKSYCKINWPFCEILHILFNRSFDLIFEISL